MRVDTWRFTEWVAFDYNTSTPDYNHDRLYLRQRRYSGGVMDRML